MVTLALSSGGGHLLSSDGGTLWGMSTAYAANVTVGVGEDQSGDVNGGDTDNNTVTIGAEGGGDHPVIGGNVAGGSSANATENVVTVNSIKLTRSDGTIYGGIATGTASKNTVIFKDGTATSLVGGTTTGASGSAQGNTVTVTGGKLNYVWGGLAQAGSSSATGNIVNINGGIFSSGGVIIGGGGRNGVTGNMSNNTVTITGGALNNNNKIYAGDSRSLSSTSNGNIVNLGDENGNFSANLNRAEIWGTSYGGQVQGNDSDKIRGNTLNVNASGIRLEMVRNFQKINFNLTKSVTAGSTMLTMDTGNFGLGYGKAFDWENFSLTGKENDTDKTKYGRIGNINLLFAYSGSDMKIGNYTTGGRKGTTGDYEYHMEADGSNFMGSRSSKLIKANVDRFKNADATVNNAAGSYVYGGYSSLGNTTTNNKIKVTNTNNTSLNVIGGRTDGTGDSTNNHVTIADTSTVNYVFGGWATKADSKAEGNSATIESGSTTKNFVYGGFAKNTAKTNKVTLGGTAEKIVYGGYADVTAQGNVVTVTGSAEQNVYGGWVNGTGTAEGNEVHIEGGTLKQFVTGGIGKVDSTVTGNKVFMTGGTVTRNIIGGETSGTNGKATKNIIEISGGTVNGFLNGGFIAGGTATENEVAISGDTTTVKQSVNGGYDTQSGTLTKNKVTISGGTVEQFVYGGYSNDSGTVTGNEVMFSNGTVKKNINGGYALTGGTVTGNKVTISGGTLEQNAYAGYSDKYGTVTGNILTITGGTIKGTVYGGAGGDNNAAYTAKTFAANNNTVTITGGTFSKAIYGAYSWHSSGTTENNTVNLGDDTHTDLSAATLSASEIYGGNKAATGNTLNVNAKNITVKSVNNFENYKFKLNESFENGDTMLSVADAGDFSGTGVDWSKITVDRSGLSADYVSNVHGVRRVTLLKSATANALHFTGYNTRTYTATDTHESRLRTDTGNAAATSVLYEVNRFKGGRVTYDGTAETINNEIYGGVSYDGHTTTDNQLTVKGLKAANDPKSAFGGINKGATGDVKKNTLNIELANDSDTIDEAYAGKAENANNTGEVSGNVANMKKGTVNKLYGGHDVGKGAVKDNVVNFSGGTVNTEVAGGVGHKANENTVTITGGTVSGNVYGGKSDGSGASASGNTVNLGAEDGAYTANLKNAALHGDNASGTGATLNVRAKNITAKSAKNFANYTFQLNDDIAKNGGSMLTLTENNGFNGGNLFDWTKLDVDTSKLSGSTVIGKATLLTGTANGLKFSNYAGRNKTTAATNGDYETALRTDTNTGTATKVVLDYNRFQNNANATYDGSKPATQLADGSTEIYGGISYAGNTTKNNHLTVTNLAGNVTSAYGGKTAGAKGDSVKNSVTVEKTGTGAISNVFGGYTASQEATAKAADNTATIKSGTFGAVYGGYVKNAASATGNHVFIKGGTVQTAVVGGGGKSTATGNMSGNDVTITGGKVTGYVIGGDTRLLTSTSNKNIINLGDDAGKYTADLSGAEVWGTSYNIQTFANTDAKIAGNTLNVQAKDGVTLKKVRNVEKFNFRLHDDTTKTAPLLNLTEAGGFGKVSADNSDVKVKWSNVTADLSNVTTAKDAAKIQGKNTYTLMRAADNSLKFSDYAARYAVYGGVYETGLRTDTGTATAKEVLYDVNRFKDGRVTYTVASMGEAVGGYSAFGNTTEGNTLTVTGTATGTNAYGGKTMGDTGGSKGNTAKITGGSLANVYGGYVDKAANNSAVTGNKVTLTGGTVTTAVYGGYTAGAGKTTDNTVNIGDGSAATLAAGANLEHATLAGGNKADDVTGNTLNVMVKDASAKKAQNFENYTFHLTDHIAADKPKSGVIDDSFTKSRGTMLTLAEGFDGQTADWNKVKIDTSKLSADKTLGAITLMKSTATGKLKFSNYAAKNHAVSGDYEVVQRTDTNTSVASAVLIDVNRFKNGDATYQNGDNNAKTYAGVSYGGNTAENNKFTLKGISEGKTLKYVSGGRSEGTAGGAVKNTVNLLGTGKGTLEEVYGGYVGSAANAADAAENTVNIAGGTAKNVYGGYTRGTGKTTKNTVNIGYTDDKGVFHDVADGAKVTGTIYGGSSDADVTGNTLNVSGKLTAGNIKNFESVKFHVRNTMASGTTLLTLDGAAKTEGLDWKNVTLSGDFKPAVKSYEAYHLTLMANEKGIDFRKGGVDTYAPIGAKGVTKGDYESVIDTDTHTAQAKAVHADVYRFRGNTATYGEADGVHDAAWGGRSLIGNDATGNTLTITGGTLKDAYGGWSAGKTTGNTVNFSGGTVTGTIYGGSSDATGNTLNIKGVQSAGNIKNFEKLHFDTSMAKAGDTLLTLKGGAATTGLDWQKLEAAGLDEGKLRTLTGAAREELFSLMANAKGLDFGTTYDKAKEKTVGDYEYAIAKEADTAKGAAAEKVVVRGFRFQNNADAVYETGDNKAAWGGRSIVGNTVQKNKLTVKGGTLTDAAYGGLSARGAVTGNTLVLAGGTLKNAYGGFVEGAGSATKNIVEVQKDTQAQIYGGHAAQGEASGNILNLGAVNIGANVYGGSGKKTEGNIINLSGTKIKGVVTGGTAALAAGGKANILAIRAAGTQIDDFMGVQNLKFYLPAGAKSSMTTMLRLGVKEKSIKGLNVDLDLSGAAKALKKTDVFSLMKVAEGGVLTTDEKIAGEVTGTQGVSLDYKFRVQKKGTDELIAAVENVEIKGSTKSLVETRTTATDVLSGGMNMLTDTGIAAAVEAAAAANVNAKGEAAPVASKAAPNAKAAVAANMQTGDYTAWAAQGGASMRIHSGSYVDTHGYMLNVGFARKQEQKTGELLFGPFVEYGRATYDSYLDDGTHGSGKTSYIGAGVLARQDMKNGVYVEGSLRAGSIKSDYTGSVSSRTASYDITNPYYAIHLSAGKKMQLKAGDTLETYVKYFYSHQNGTSGKLSTGEDYDFDAVDSHRLRLGARYAHDMGADGKFYAGLAWEYEFNGEARAAYQGMATPSPTLKGASGMLELGYRFAPKKSRISYDVNLSGWQGKREGFTGGVSVNWAF